MTLNEDQMIALLLAANDNRGNSNATLHAMQRVLGIRKDHIVLPNQNDLLFAAETFVAADSNVRKAEDSTAAEDHAAAEFIAAVSIALAGFKE
jgi:hypothetical protein